MIIDGRSLDVQVNENDEMGYSNLNWKLNDDREHENGRNELL